MQLMFIYFFQSSVLSWLISNSYNGKQNATFSVALLYHGKTALSCQGVVQAVKI